MKGSPRHDFMHLLSRLYPAGIGNRRGSVMIITLLLLMFLTGLVVEFAYGVFIGTSTVSNWSNAQKASFIAKSGQSLSSHYMKEIRDLYTQYDRVTLPVPFDFGEGTLLTVTIEDENAKFNINSIIYDNGETNKDALNALKLMFQYLDVDPSLGLFIADWIDPDSEPRIGDSELNAKNSYLWDTGELKYIQGIDDETFAGISPFITVYGKDDLNWININTAPLPVLMSLHDDMTEVLAQRVIDYRESTPFEKKIHIIKVSGLESLGLVLRTGIRVQGTYFRITASATVNETTRVIESVMDTSMKIELWREG